MVREGNRGYLDEEVVATVDEQQPRRTPERSPVMFDAYCQSCSRRRLVFAGQVRGIANDDAGIHVTFECWCGALSTWSTGRSRERSV